MEAVSIVIPASRRQSIVTFNKGWIRYIVRQDLVHRTRDCNKPYHLNEHSLLISWQIGFGVSLAAAVLDAGGSGVENTMHAGAKTVPEGAGHAWRSQGKRDALGDRFISD